MKKLIGVVIVLSSMVFGQFTSDTRPRLELLPRLNLNGGGFQPVSASMTGGTGMETQNLIWHVYGTYDAARKVEWTDLADNTNPHGNIRSVGGDLLGRTSKGWLFGVEGGYSQLRTTNYSKTRRGIGVGGGKDWASLTCPTCNDSTSLRLTLFYGLPINANPDTEQGFTAECTIPSPAESHRHVFFKVSAFAGWIDVPGKGITHDGSSNMGLLFRF